MNNSGQAVGASLTSSSHPKLDVHFGSNCPSFSILTRGIPKNPGMRGRLRRWGEWHQDFLLLSHWKGMEMARAEAERAQSHLLGASPVSEVSPTCQTLGRFFLGIKSLPPPPKDGGEMLEGKGRIGLALKQDSSTPGKLGGIAQRKLRNLPWD